MQMTTGIHDSRRALGRLFRMGLPELVCRGRQETLKIVDRLRPLPVRVAARNKPVTTVERFVANAEKRFFAGAFDARLSDELTKQDREEVLVAANRSLRGRFDLLGYRDLEFGDPIDWHLDPVAGTRAPFVHWTRINPMNTDMVGDSKVVWELNRHQWVVQLAQAWRLTRDARYANAVVETLLDWIRRNPPGIGVNWASSLEVAFRIITWSWSLVLVRDASALTTAAFNTIEASIDAHALHVERYLSYYFSPNTHLTGEALGLFYAGIMFPHLKHADRWQSTAVRILVEQIERQVLPDGIYFERSTCYQRYTVDFYLHFLMLAATAAVQLPPATSEAVKSMVDALIALRSPDGTMPDIGDADGGVLLPLAKAPASDFRGTFSTAAVVFRNEQFAWAAGRLAPETLWLAGTRATAIFNQLAKTQPPSPASRVFITGGFVAMRNGWSERAHSLIFDTGPLGCHYSSGHGHADLLSIQCSAFGRQFLVDPGTGCYTADKQRRNFFRGTAAHNTITVDGKSQAEPAGPFSWKTRCAARLLRWIDNDDVTYADAEHDAYGTLADPVTHRRRVAFVNSRFWIVIDDLEGAQTHKLDLHFQFAPMQVRIDDRGYVRATANGREGLVIRSFASMPFEVDIREGRTNPFEGWVSPAYGQMTPAPAVVYTANAQLPARMLTLLWPADDVNQRMRVDVLRDSQRRPFGIKLHDLDQTIIFADDGPVIHEHS